MVQIKFITFGATSAGGSFAPGDTLRCSEEMAHHLVNEAKCAVFMQPKAQAAEAEPEKPAVRRARKAKE